jgi:hypothetical protein
MGYGKSPLVEHLADDICYKLGKQTLVREEKPIRMGKRGLPQPDTAGKAIPGEPYHRARRVHSTTGLSQNRN